MWVLIITSFQGKLIKFKPSISTNAFLSLYYINCYRQNLKLSQNAVLPFLDRED